MGYYGEEGLKLLSDIASKFGESFIIGYSIDKNESKQEVENKYRYIFNNIVRPRTDEILKSLSDHNIHFDKDEIKYVHDYISHFLTIYEMGDINKHYDAKGFTSIILKKLMGTLYGDKQTVDEAFNEIHNGIYYSFKNDKASKAYEDNVHSKILGSVFKDIFKAGIKRVAVPLAIAGSLFALIGAYKLYRKKKYEKEKEKMDREL